MDFYAEIIGDLDLIFILRKTIHVCDVDLTESRFL